MKQICNILGRITLIGGAIGSFVLAYSAGATLSVSRGTLELTRNWLLTIIYFLVSLICVAAISAILLGLAKILEHLELIDEGQDDLIQYTKPDIEEEIPQGYWKCPNCGKGNPPYAGTCGCGQPKA